jgi:hypothetical protein
LPDGESWDVLRTSIERTIQTGTHEEFELCMTTVEGIVSDGSGIGQELERLLGTICEAARSRWDAEERAIDPKKLRGFYAISSKTRSEIPSPHLANSWVATYEKADRALKDSRLGIDLDGTGVREWAEMAATLSLNEPRYLRKIDYPESYVPTAKAIMERANDEALAEYQLESSDDYFSESERFSHLATAAKELSVAFPEFSVEWGEVAAHLEQQRESLVAQYERKQEEEARRKEDEPEEEGESRGAEIFDLSELFSDL